MTATRQPGLTGVANSSTQQQAIPSAMAIAVKLIAFPSSAIFKAI